MQLEPKDYIDLYYEDVKNIEIKEPEDILIWNRIFARINAAS